MDIKKLEALISDKRAYGKSYGNLAIAVESDRGRILNSAAVRRLQQKTQVFPLERNAAVRSRLTHSLEVQQNGRFIVQEIERLVSSASSEANKDLFRAIESIVEMSCLMHDIGNPPFGHFGETAISSWFEEHIDDIFPELENSSTQPSYDELKKELTSFEGNAQAIRMVHSLQGLNLTYTQIAAVLKYTRLATHPRPKNTPFDYLQKKPGYYFSEAELINNIYKELNMLPGHRHPLAYIMEAADDISYGLADIEDAVEKDVLNVAQVLEGLRNEFEELKGDLDAKSFSGMRYGSPLSFNELLDEAESSYNKKTIDKANKFFVRLRVLVHNNLCRYAAKRFVDNFDAVVSGHYNGALLEDDSSEHKMCAALKNLANKKVFTAPEVIQEELRGHRIIHGLLDTYEPLLRLRYDDFTGIANDEREPIKRNPLCTRLFKKLPGKHVRAYLEAMKKHPNNPLIERYYRCRLLQDYISGMTDQFAYDEYRSLNVSD